MPAKDKFHDAVKNALVKDGWTITHDPYKLKLGKTDFFVDLGARKLLAAEKGEEKIAVEIKSFLGKSVAEDARNALGQYEFYRGLIEEAEAERILYLAMDKLKRYRELICQIIKEYAAIPYAHVDLTREPVFDCENDRYLLIVYGRENKKLIHHALIHVDIINNKFWIHFDGTEDGVATDLLEAGVPKDDIVLAFYSLEKRKYTEFAVA